MENVEEFQDWGPLGADGRPDPKRRGQSFRRWEGRVRGLGYQIEARELVAADYGAPTTRRRVFIIARCDGQPIVWPEPTHAQYPGERMFDGVKRWRRVFECLDLSIPMQPIERIPALADSTLALISKGRARLEGESAFLISYYGNGGVHSISDPLPTVTTKDRFGLIAGDRMRMLTPRELAAAQGFPADYWLPDNKSTAVRLIGNSVCPPLAEAIVRANLPECAVEVAA